MALVLSLTCISVSGCAKFLQVPETLADLSDGDSGGGSGDAGDGDSDGDGDGDGDDDDGQPYVDQYGPQYAIGTPSTRDAVSDKLFLGTKRNQPYVAPGNINYDSLFAAHTALNTTSNLPIASRDTNVTDQWDAGWTGKGVKIGVIDDFTDNDTIDSHGDKVSLVINSVAPEANMLARHSNLISTDVEAAWSNMSTNGYHIVNNSFGRARVNHVTQETDATFDAHVTSWVNNRYKITGSATHNENMLFVFAAGNSGNYCPDKRIQACTFRAAVLHGQREAGVEDTEAYIWVGSLTDDGTALVGYSHSAGDMANDFIVAHDDVLAKGDGAGTSYAAPRVAGAAAIIRHKFPLLDGMELKTLLLTTATDMGETGPDAVFGYGKLNLANSLSPQGTLSLAPSRAGSVPEGDAPQGGGGPVDRSPAVNFALPDVIDKATASPNGTQDTALSLAALALIAMPQKLGDMSLIELSVSPHHAASKIWDGKFIGMNERAYNATDYYASRKPEFSASALWAKPYGTRVSLLLPVSFDAGYDAALYRSKPLAGLGLGAAFALTGDTMVSVRMDNVVRFGGEVSESPCYDAFRRGFHCGSGMAWSDYLSANPDRRGTLGTPTLQARFTHRFSH